VASPVYNGKWQYFIDISKLIAKKTVVIDYICSTKHCIRVVANRSMRASVNRGIQHNVTMNYDKNSQATTY